jgi:hypothetical protein
MSQPIIVTLPHRLGKAEALRRLKTSKIRTGSPPLIARGPCAWGLPTPLVVQADDVEAYARRAERHFSFLVKAIDGVEFKATLSQTSWASPVIEAHPTLSAPK